MKTVTRWLRRIFRRAKELEFEFAAPSADVQRHIMEEKLIAELHGVGDDE